MLTAGDIQFEPPQPKMVRVTNSIFLLLAGDASIQAEIWSAVLPEFRFDDQSVTVQAVADSYAKQYAEARRKRFESAYLSPLGLTSASFLQTQRLMDAELVQKLATEAINYPHLEVETIAVGVEPCKIPSDACAHIFLIQEGIVMNQDAVGFATIGIGAYHAASQFMFAGHTGIMPFSATMLLTYVAKKRAEVAPGVGSATDMVISYPDATDSGNPRAVEIVESELKFLEDTYAKMKAKEAEAVKVAARELDEHIEELGKASTQATEANGNAIMAPVD